MLSRLGEIKLTDEDDSANIALGCYTGIAVAETYRYDPKQDRK